MSEQWRAIPGYEGLYEASTLGRVRSIKRSKVLAQQLNNSGYMRVTLTKGAVAKYLYTHHLVAAAFVGVRPAGFDVNHINGVKTDNRAGNLNYMTRKENMRHAREHGLHDNRGELAYNARLTEDLVLLIREAVSTCGLSLSEMTVGLGIPRATVRDVVTRATWRHLP